MNQFQKQFLDQAAAQAKLASHPFPEMVACEAALESGWGNSALAKDANNLFGTKQHKNPIFDTFNLPTKEFLNGEWEVVNAEWVKYPDQAACFADRLSTLERLASVYPHYKAALEAQDAETYIRQVSQTWSTDPQRAEKVLSIFKEYTQ